MALILHVDQARTFRNLVFLNSQPKMAYGSDNQDITRSGIPKWEVQVVASFEVLGKLESEILKVSIISEIDPGTAIEAPASVELIGFRVRINSPRPAEVPREKLQVSPPTFQADAIRQI